MSPRKTRAAARAEQQQPPAIHVDSQADNGVHEYTTSSMVLKEITGNEHTGLEANNALEIRKSLAMDGNKRHRKRSLSQTALYDDVAETTEQGIDAGTQEHHHLTETNGVEYINEDLSHDSELEERDASDVIHEESPIDDFQFNNEDQQPPVTSEYTHTVVDTGMPEMNKPEYIAMVTTTWENGDNEFVLAQGFDGACDEILSPRKRQRSPAADQADESTNEPVTPHRTDFADSEAVQKLEALFEPIQGEDVTLEESFIAEILARTPAAMTPRESLIPQPEAVQSPTQEETAPVGDSTKKTQNDTPTTPLPAAPKPWPVQHVARRSMATKSTRPSMATRASLSVKASITTRRSSVQAAAQPSALSTQSTAATGAAVAKLKQKSAISALNTPPKVAKSSKPLTKSTFQLPGEAITAKLKAQREDRLRKEADEAEKRRQFKARPPPKATPPANVRTTALGRSRMSLQTNNIAATSTKATQANTSNPTSRRSTMRPSVIGTSRQSSATTKREPDAAKTSASSKPVGVTLDSGDATSDDRTSSAAPRAAARQSRTSSATAKPSVSAPSNRRITTTPAVRSLKSTLNSDTAGKSKGKDVFNRDRIDQGEREKMMREKAEATKKARVEAAERSRTASREWAERQIAKSKAAGSRSVSGNESSNGSGSGSEKLVAEATPATIASEA